MAAASDETTYGEFEFEGTATLFDPRGTGNPHPELTFIHEQTHRDLINNTVCGFVLSRLSELSRRQLASEHEPGELLGQLVDGLWQCAEGSATVTELIVARPKLSANEIAKFMGDLPADYRAALDIFRPVADKRREPLPEPIPSTLLQCITLTVAETAADWALFARKRLPDDFWTLVARLLARPHPDEVLPRLVRKAAAITIRRQHCAALYHAMAGKTHVPTLYRKIVYDTKRKLLQRCDIEAPRQLLHDGERIDFTAAIDDKLVAQYPDLSRITWTKEILNAEGAVTIREPAFLLPDEELQAAAMLARYRELADADQFQHFVNGFLLDPRWNTRSLVATPIHLTSEGMDIGSPYLTCRDAPEALFRDIAALGVPHVWLTSGFPVNSGGFYEEGFIRALDAPVYLQLSPFGWEQARHILRGAVKPLRATRVSLPRIGLAVATLSSEKITVFGVTAENFPPDMTPGQETHSAHFRDDPLLASVAMVVLRTSTANSVGRPTDA